jgi:hypothetical protein
MKKLEEEEKKKKELQAMEEKRARDVSSCNVGVLEINVSSVAHQAWWATEDTLISNTLSHIRNIDLIILDTLLKFCVAIHQTYFFLSMPLRLAWRRRRLKDNKEKLGKNGNKIHLWR